ncbi:MAG: hypothetical protein ACM3KR_06775 [Deltaproteobacteria bacterium]
MKKMIAVFLLFIFLILPGCSTQNSQIDMEKWQKEFKQKDERSKYNEAAKKSIFPNLKDK